MPPSRAGSPPSPAVAEPPAPPRVITRAWTIERATRAAADAPEVVPLDGPLPGIPLALSSEIPVLRYDWWEDEEFYEVLSHAAGDIDLSRAAAGLPFLVDHDRGEHIGIIRDVQVGDDQKLRGTLFLSRSDEGREFYQDILDGIRTQVSCGYQLSREFTQTDNGEGNPPTRTYRGWTPLEGSGVAIPADPTVGYGRSARAGATPVRSRPAHPAPQAEEYRMDIPTTPAAAPAAPVTPISVAPEAAELRRIEVISGHARTHALTEHLPRWIETKASIEDAQRDMINLLAERMSKPVPQSTGMLGLNEKEIKRYSVARALLGETEGERNIDDGFEREIHDELVKQRAPGMPQVKGRLVPWDAMFTRAGLDSGTSTKGSELKFTQPGEWIPMLRNRAAVKQAGARMLTGLTGPMSLPKQTSAASGSWVGENPGSDVADSNLLLSLATLAFKTYQASTSFSKQLLFSALSASISAEQMVRDDLYRIFELAIDLAALHGTGSSNQPTGVITNTSVGVVAAGTSGATLTYNNIVDLANLPGQSNADIGSMAFITNAKQRGALSKVAVLGNTASGVAVWQNQLVDVGPNGRMPIGAMYGFPAYVSNQVASNLTKGSSTTICSAVFFGSWENLIIGYFGNGFEVITDPYRLKKQGMIEVTGFQAVDVALRYPEAFSVIKDAL